MLVTEDFNEKLSPSCYGNSCPILCPSSIKIGIARCHSSRSSKTHETLLPQGLEHYRVIPDDLHYLSSFPLGVRVVAGSNPATPTKPKYRLEDRLGYPHLWRTEHKRPATEHLLHHTLATYDSSYLIEIAKRLTDAAVVITSPIEAPHQIDYAIRTAPR
jgi:hypothetical protein